jgi:hypothetical protein
MQNGTVEIVSADGLTVYKQLGEVHIHPFPIPLRIRSAAQLATYLTLASPHPQPYGPVPMRSSAVVAHAC